MTSEAHVTISAAQQGGMHPFVHLTSPPPPFHTRKRRLGAKDSQREEYYLLRSLGINSLKTYYYIKRD